MEKIMKTPRDAINFILFNERALRIATYEIEHNAIIKFKYPRHVRHFKEAFKKVGVGYELKDVGTLKLQVISKGGAQDEGIR